jgi:hypothetical protein
MSIESAGGRPVNPEPEALSESERVRRDIAAYKDIPADVLIKLAEYAYAQALVNQEAVETTPRQAWGMAESAVREAQFSSWVQTLGRLTLAMWKKGIAWAPADEPKVVG